jgi:hypothetical protein
MWYNLTIEMFGLIEIPDFVFQNTIFFLSEWTFSEDSWLCLLKYLKPQMKFALWNVIVTEWLSHRHAFLVGVHVCFEKGEDIRYYFSCSPEISSSISVSEHLKLWNFPFSWTHATPILDCKPTWPFLQEKCDTIGQHANKRPLGMDSAFTWVHDILTTVNTRTVLA